MQTRLFLKQKIAVLLGGRRRQLAPHNTCIDASNNLEYLNEQHFRTHFVITSAHKIAQREMSRYVLCDRWKTHFGAVQHSPVIVERIVEGKYERLYPVYVLEWSELEKVGVTGAGSKAADVARSACDAHWTKLEVPGVPVRLLTDEYGTARWLDIGDELRWLTPLDARRDEELLQSAAASSSTRFDDVAQLQVERIEPRHLPGLLLLEYELFGTDNTLVEDFVSCDAAGYCAIDSVTLYCFFLFFWSVTIRQWLM
jgi:hypothetical protein